VNSSLNFEVFLHKIDGIAEYERVDLLDSVSKLQKESFLEAEMGDINLRSVLLVYNLSVGCYPGQDNITVGKGYKRHMMLEDIDTSSE